MATPSVGWRRSPGKALDGLIAEYCEVPGLNDDYLSDALETSINDLDRSCQLAPCAAGASVCPLNRLWSVMQTVVIRVERGFAVFANIPYTSARVHEELSLLWQDSENH